MKADGYPHRLLIRGLDFLYGRRKALHNVNCAIPDRKVTAFIGPLGLGKSTLLRIFNRIFSLYPGQKASGEVLLSGHNILAQDCDVNLLQRPTPFPMSIFDNVAYGVQLHAKLSARLKPCS